MITVSIVTYKTDTEELQKCLTSLYSFKVKKIFVVDNSKQQYLEDFCKRIEKVEYIPSENVDDVVWALDKLVVDKDKLKCIIDNALRSANTLYTESNYVSNNYHFVRSLLW